MKNLFKTRILPYLPFVRSLDYFADYFDCVRRNHAAAAAAALTTERTTFGALWSSSSLPENFTSKYHFTLNIAWVYLILACKCVEFFFLNAQIGGPRDDGEFVHYNFASFSHIRSESYWFLTATFVMVAYFLHLLYSANYNDFTLLIEAILLGRSNTRRMMRRCNQNKRNICSASEFFIYPKYRNRPVAQYVRHFALTILYLYVTFIVIRGERAIRVAMQAI